MDLRRLGSGLLSTWQAWANWPATVSEVCDIPANELVFAGIAVGFADELDGVNELRSLRGEAREWLKIVGEEPWQQQQQQAKL